ncbi:MAG: delta-60 repeat domain-containing protein, partial [Anaerolineae bacterium]
MKKQIISTKIVGWTTMLVFPLALTILTLRLMGAAAAPAATDFLDSDFDGDGRVTIPISGSSQIGREMAIQPDGKLIIAGYDKWQTSNTDAILARVNPDGSLDGTFGAGGVVTTAFSSGNDAAYAVAAQQDGKIVAAGYTTAGSHSVAVVMRYNADGSLDNSFGNNGVVTTSLQPDNSWFLSVAVLDDGRIVAGGTVDSNPDAFLLTRYQANGAPDTTLGGSGVVTTTIPGGDAA